MDTDQSTRTPVRGYALFTAFLLIWSAVLLFIAVKLIPDAYWYSYYAVDYDLGFVRRGLAGELVNALPGSDYFGTLRVIRWLPTAAMTAALAVLMRAVYVSGRGERRLMLALLVPVLPFGFAVGVFSARPDLFGAAAVVLFAVSVATARSDRTVLAASAVYGLAIAVLALTHEAIPLLFSLGALAAIAVLGAGRAQRVLRLSAVLAVAPGLLTTAAIALLGRKGVSEQLCERVPHAPTNHPLAGNPSLGELLRGYKFYIDYHGWVCRNITPLYDQTLTDGARFVGSLGPAALVGSTVFGIVVLAVTMLAISHVAGVPVGRFRAALSTKPLWLAFGLVLILPVFATAVDWVRWWVMISLDLGVVFAIFAARQPEASAPATRRTRAVFFAGAILLAALPIGVIPGFGAPIPL